MSPFQTIQDLTPSATIIDIDQTKLNLQFRTPNGVMVSAPRAKPSPTWNPILKLPTTLPPYHYHLAIFITFLLFIEHVASALVISLSVTFFEIAFLDLL